MEIDSFFQGIMTWNGNFPVNLPTLDGKNWKRWYIQMKVFFGALEVFEIVQEGYEELGENPTEAQRTTFKDAKKRDCMALFYIHQCVDSNNFEKISKAVTSKEAWDILVKYYTGRDNGEKVKLQALRKIFELMHMEEEEKINDYFTRLVRLVNQMKGCGEIMPDRLIVDKVMRTLTSRFGFIVDAIEESRDVSTMTIEELQSTLEAKELRWIERGAERLVDQAESSKKGGGGGGNVKNKSRRKRQDKRKIQCFNCEKWGHYGDDCWLRN